MVDIFYPSFLKSPHLSNQSASGFVTGTDVLESKDKECIIPNEDVVHADNLGPMDISICFYTTAFAHGT